jgi:hypothetical protein
VSAEVVMRHERSSIRNAPDNTILKTGSTLCTLCVGMQLARIASIRWASSVWLALSTWVRRIAILSATETALALTCRSSHVQTVEMQM